MTNRKKHLDLRQPIKFTSDFHLHLLKVIESGAFKCQINNFKRNNHELNKILALCVDMLNQRSD